MLIVIAVKGQKAPELCSTSQLLALPGQGALYTAIYFQIFTQPSHKVSNIYFNATQWPLCHDDDDDDDVEEHSDDQQGS